MYIAPLNKHRKRTFKPPEIKRIRTILKLSRPEFGDLLWVSGETVKSWEVGRRNPDGPARLLLCHYHEIAESKRTEENSVLDRTLKMAQYKGGK